MSPGPSPAAAPAVRLAAVTVRRGDRATLDAIDLAIASGETVALIGPSGAGKTTLLSVLGAALRPGAGQVSIAGANPWALAVRDLRRLRATLFVAPQAPPLPPRQRVVSAVLAGRLANWGLARAIASLWRPRTGDVEVAFDALERFDLGDKLWQRVDRLSGGERQRVSLARLVASDARLLLVDEPLSALDPTLAARALDALLAEAAERGATLACSLHQVDLALSRFPRVVGLRDGRVLFDRPSRAIGPTDLARLYEGHEDERDAPAAPGPPTIVPGPPVSPARCA